MNTRSSPEPTESAPRAGAGDRAALAAWHAGWAVAAALLALGARWIGGVEGPVFYSVLALLNAFLLISLIVVFSSYGFSQ